MQTQFHSQWVSVRIPTSIDTYYLPGSSFPRVPPWHSDTQPRNLLREPGVQSSTSLSLTPLAFEPRDIPSQLEPFHASHFNLLSLMPENQQGNTRPGGFRTASG